MTGEDNPNWKGGMVEVSCDTCGNKLSRKQCELDPNSSSYSKQFFCDQKCSGIWKKKNLVGEKIYNFTPEIEVPCGFCLTILLRKRHSMRPGQKAYCNKECMREAYKKKTLWNKKLNTSSEDEQYNVKPKILI